jgi:hypothetical protein
VSEKRQSWAYPLIWLGVRPDLPQHPTRRAFERALRRAGQRADAPEESEDVPSDGYNLGTNLRQCQVMFGSSRKGTLREEAYDRGGSE